MQTILDISDVSKSYRLGKLGSRYLFEELRSRFGRKRQGTSPHRDSHVTALSSVSFSVAAGESVGIIGSNGSGKSTLLKLCAGVTLPTHGTIDITGRAAALLDIGVGFQGDLSARENIFLNGAILGMRRRELLNKFNDIVAFSEIDRFIDTPVKRLSSGMYLRLVFSIAIHCAGDIFLIDEILAAADHRFLLKCINKLREYTSRGITLLLVSHNDATIQTLCQRSILLENGHIVADGPTSDIIERYHTTTTTGGYHGGEHR